MGHSKDDNNWEWEKLVDSGDKDPSCLDYCKGWLAISNPRRGIRLWILERGRSIINKRMNYDLI